MLVLLLAKTDAILKKKAAKNIVRFFYFSCNKIVFALLTEIIIGYIVNFFINVRKICFKKILTKAFCSRGSGFHYCLNNILYIFI